jgi:uncharacterized protein YecT (DUF1311 family)
MRHTLACCLWITTGLIFSGVAFADDCATASSQQAMNICADQAFKVADKALNTSYQQVTQRLKDNPDSVALLVKAQRAWIAFRDTQCEFATSAAAQGSIYPMLVAQCRSELTQTRTKDLNALLECDETDLSCPVPGP